MPKHLHLEHFGPVTALPVLHYKAETAHLVRSAVTRVDPDCIAIELPATLESQFLAGVRRLPQISVLSYELNAKSGKSATSYLLIEPADPLVEAARLAQERGIPIAFIDVDVDRYPDHPELLPDSYAIHRIGLSAYYAEYCRAFENSEPALEDKRRENGMAWRLQQLSDKYDRILLVCGMAHLARIKELFSHTHAPPLERRHREGVRLSNLHPDSCREILGEIPFLNSIYELRRAPLLPEPDDSALSLRKSFHAFELITGGKQTRVPQNEALLAAAARSSHHVGREGEMPDRQRIQLRLFLEAARHYRQETGETVHIWQKRAFFRFTRNYAALVGRLLPDLFQLLAAARGCIDDNFAYALYRLATYYPWQKDSAEIPTLRLSPEEVWGGAVRIRFRPRQPRPGKGLSPLQYLRRRKEKKPGEWLQGFDDPSICSYPPEDAAIEAYGNFLKKKGAAQLSEEQCRVEPLTSSLLDGIDMRETLRNFHTQRIYVRELQRIKEGVGNVVVIFSEDRDNSRFPYLMTWLGEHEQESDMAFYATSPAENVVGPGICRCEYGGFILSYPPKRMLDVWTDPDYGWAQGKHEILLLAALDYSREKHIIYAAPRPPRSIFKQLASRMGKTLVYMPLGSLSPVKLKQLRVVHVLYGHDKRALAKDYIW